MTIKRSSLRVAGGLAALLLTISTTFAYAQSFQSRAQDAGNDRIVGGVELATGDGPWAVRLNITRGGQSFICGGSLIQPVATPTSFAWDGRDPYARWVVTAAHCVFDPITGDVLEPSAVSAVTGRVDLEKKDEGEKRGVVAVIAHPEYDPATLEHDIALLILNESDVELEAVRRGSIRLPSTQDTHWIARDYLALVAQGWGRTESGGTSQVLREVRVPLVSKDLCASNYAIHGVHLAPGMICAGYFSGGFDSCAGDSGGPLLFRNTPESTKSIGVGQEVLVGVVSWGIGCGRQDMFGVYTSVAYYRGWMEQAVRNCLAQPTRIECHNPS